MTLTIIILFVVASIVTIFVLETKKKPTTTLTKEVVPPIVGQGPIDEKQVAGDPTFFVKDELPTVSPFTGQPIVSDEQLAPTTQSVVTPTQPVVEPVVEPAKPAKKKQPKKK